MSQKGNFEIRKELQVKVYLNYNIPSLQIALRHCLLKCKNINNGNKTKINNIYTGAGHIIRIS